MVNGVYNRTMDCNISLVITTYERSDALAAVLESITHQTLTPSQVIIADDGSSIATQKLITEWKERLPLTYCWQPDREFRAARARNLALEKCETKYVVLIDGDCVLPPHFLAAHKSLAKPSYIVAGGRSLLPHDATEKLLNTPGMILGSKVFNRLKFFRLNLGILRDLSPKNWEIARTCNLSFFTDDAKNIGGFDENYIGWGREDTDFVIRMLNAGRLIRSGRLGACVLHLWHPNDCRHNLSRNDLLLKNCMHSRLIYAKRSLLNED